MNDFCLKFVNMPQDAYFEANQQVLKAKLWRQMTDILEAMAEEQGIEFNINDPRFQIVDINFAATDLRDVEILFRLNKVRTQMKMIEARRARSREDGQTCCGSSYARQLEECGKRFDEIRQEFYDHAGALSRGAVNLSSQQ